MSEAADALARTVQLIADDVFERRPGEDPELEANILRGLGETTVRLVADGHNVSSESGQTALMTLFGLLAMMGLGIVLDMPEVGILGAHGPLVGDELRAGLLAYGHDLIPSARIGVEAGPPSLTFVLGNSDGTVRGRTLNVSGDAWRCRIHPGPDGVQWRGTWPIGALAAAGAAAAEGYRVALESIAEIVGHALADRPGIRFDPDRSVDLDLSVPGLPDDGPVLEPTDFISGGAITTSALHCLNRIPDLAGEFRVIEPDHVEISNLNRYPLMRLSDCGRPKVDVLAERSRSGLRTVGVAERFDETTAQSIAPLASQVLVGVDEIPARWAVQRAAPGWLCVGGTSHLYALVTTHDSGEPCAGCAHPRDDDFAGPIPTISFVSFWAGLVQVRELLARAGGARRVGQAINVWPSGLYGPRPLHVTGVAPRADCPVGCRASRAGQRNESS